MLTSTLQKLRPILRNPIPAMLGIVLFFSAAHHAFNFWELPLGVMAVIFLFAIPFLVLVTASLWDKVSSHLKWIDRNRLILLTVTSVLMGSFIAWRVYRVPVSTHTITIQPLVSGSATVGLLEVQPNTASLGLKETALKNKWEASGNVLYATSRSQPLTIHFSGKANMPVDVLFQDSPGSGSVRVSLDGKVMAADLHADANGERLLRLQTRYRGIPNGLFLPGLFLADVVTFGALILFLLMIQEIHQMDAGALSPNDSSHLTVHRRSLLVLLLVGFVIHLMNALATPLLVGPDSPSFLEGSFHLLQFGNLDGVSTVHGVGTTFLFAPVLFLFGRNPWGMKILLHLIALACIPLSYRIGWQVSRNSSVAFLAGLLAVFSVDLIFYSNYVMSDVPNIFIVLAFMTLLISALEGAEVHWLFSAMLVGSFAVLLRSENIVMLGIGMVFLPGSAAWNWRQTGASPSLRFKYMSVAFGIALLPILWWSFHNLKVHGFFGLSNYLNEVLYDGWVYSGDANRLSFSDAGSPAVKTINAVMDVNPNMISDKSGVPTGWEVYLSLLKAGYTSDQAFDLLGSATWDSIRHDPGLDLKLLFIKYRSGLRPEITFNNTYSLPGESKRTDEPGNTYFDSDPINLPALIVLQRQINAGLTVCYPGLYPVWVLSCLLLAFISLFRSPWYIWGALVVITLSRIFISLTLGTAFWRYVLPGWLPAQIIAVSGIRVLLDGIRTVFRHKSHPALP